MELAKTALFVIVGAGISVIFVGIIRKFFTELGIKNRKLILLLESFILLLFFSGFAFRVSEEKTLVDFGFMLTDASFLLVYLLFTTALLAGQVKYYGANR